MEREFSELLDRAKRAEPGSREALLEYLRPWLIGIMMRRFAKLLDGQAEILDDCELTLLRWLNENPDLARSDEPPGDLAWRLLAQCGKQWTRDRKHDRGMLKELRQAEETGLKRGGAKLFGGPLPELDYEVTGVDAQRAIAALGEPHRSTLLAEVEHQLGHGKPLEERFGLTPAAARQRLCRAREALLELIREGKDDSHE